MDVRVLVLRVFRFLVYVGCTRDFVGGLVSVDADVFQRGWCDCSAVGLGAAV